MAFRRFRRRSAGFRKGFRRSGRNPYELAQISICRKGLELGLSSCDFPDQFFHPIATYRDWMAPLVQIAGGAANRAWTPHAGKSITVRGIQFDYQYSVVPQAIANEDNEAIGVTGIRSALVVMKTASNPDDTTVPAPDGPPVNILHHTQALRYNIQSGSDGIVTDAFSKYRILWRGMEMMGNVLFHESRSDVATFYAGVTPRFVTQSRHVRVRTACRLNWDEGLFFVSEVVNPFLNDNPTIGLDLFGSCVIKTNFTGPVKYDTTGP